MKYSELFTIMLTACFLIFVSGCNPSEKQDQEKGEIDTIEVKTKSTGEDLKGDRRGIEDSVIYEFVQNYPEMHISYIPSDEGKVRTVRGNYLVSVDAVSNETDQAEFVRYIEERHSKRAASLDEFNKNIETPAKPKNGYDAYDNALDQQLSQAGITEEGTVFVEFIVSEDGRVTNVKAADDTFYATETDAVDQVLEVVKTTDVEWQPAQQGGKPVKMKFEIPITINEN